VTGRQPACVAAVLLVLSGLARSSIVPGFSAIVEAQARDAGLPELTQPVNDFAGVIDAPALAEIDRMSRTLKAATGDVVVVATVKSIDPYGDIREYANKLFENHGRGVGDKGKDNGLLILLAVRERKVWVEVGYVLEQWVTDGFAGETSRLYMVPEFRQGLYGEGLRIGTERIIGRIAQGRNVTLQGVRVPRERTPQRPSSTVPGYVFLAIVILVALSRIGGGRGSGLRTWGGSGWSGWSSGVGPFGGGGGGGGGFGGGFGGFGGGSSGGGGGGGSW
jgi:uncharacterized protein